MCVCFVNNFMLEDLLEVSCLCWVVGVCFYIMFNIVFYDYDLFMMCCIVGIVVEYQIDVVIVMEFGVMQYVCELGVDVYLFMQVNIINVEVVKFYVQFVEVMVFFWEFIFFQVV